MLRFGEPRQRRPISLTPMIDVVFLLLVFFMLVGRFGLDRPLEMTLAPGSIAVGGPPRLVDVSEDALCLNGVPVDADGMTRGLADLTRAPEDLIVLRVGDDVGVQRLVDVMSTLDAAGFVQVSVIGGAR